VEDNMNGDGGRASSGRQHQHGSNIVVAQDMRMAQAHSETRINAGMRSSVSRSRS